MYNLAYKQMSTQTYARTRIYMYVILFRDTKSRRMYAKYLFVMNKVLNVFVLIHK